MSDAPSTLKERLRSDLTAAIRDRDKIRSGTIRMVLTAITEAEVAGSEAVELSDQQVLDVVIREAKKRREAESAYANAGRAELAEKERAESDVLGDYLPQQLTEQEIATIVADAIVSTGATELGMKGMGKVMAQVTPQTKGRADGSVVAAEVRRQLSGSCDQTETKWPWAFGTALVSVLTAVMGKVRSDVSRAVSLDGSDGKRTPRAADAASRQPASCSPGCGGRGYR